MKVKTIPEVDVKRNKGFLSYIEKVGNKIPHTMSMFITMVGLVFVTSLVFSGASAVNPSTGKTITIVNLLSLNGLVMIFTKFVDNFGNFPILGITIVIGIGMGLCEVTGLFNTVVRLSFKNVKGATVAIFVAFLGVFMCSLDGSVSMIIIPTIAGSIYYSMGKNPLIGVFSGFAAASAGAAMEFIPGFFQVVFTPLTVKYAQTIDPNFFMPLMSDYYATTVGAFLVVITNAFVTLKFIEPRFKDYSKDYISDDIPKEKEITDVEKKAAKFAGISLAVYLILLIVSCIPSHSFMRGPSGSLIVDAPLMDSINFLLFLFFLIPGIVYARKTGQVKNMQEFANALADGLKSLLPFIVLAVIISQFLAFFKASNLAEVMAIKGGQALSALHLPYPLIVTVLFFFYVFITIFICSGSTKYLLFAPILVPMMMQLNIHPAFTQFLLRMSEGTTNNLSPFNAFFPIIIGLAAKYDKRSGVGTVFSAMVPYSLAYIIVLLTLVLVWMFLGLPLGISGAHFWLK